jgi:hypothetical protein
MSRLPTALDDLQRFVLTAVTAADPCAADTESLIRSSQQQTPAERLAVYRHAYVARLLGVLRELFPCTRFAVGDELFDQFCIGYLQAHPPASYTLSRLANHFSDYLEATRPADWGTFIVELTRLEQAIDRVFDGPGPEKLPPLRIPSVTSGSARLRFAPGCELLAFHCPVSSYYTAWKAGEAAGWPNPRKQYIALVRRDYIVRRHDLAESQFRILAALQEGGSLDDAVHAAGSSAHVANSVQQWFHTWTTAGFFIDIY